MSYSLIPSANAGPHLRRELYRARCHKRTALPASAASRADVTPSGPPTDPYVRNVPYGSSRNAALPVPETLLHHPRACRGQVGDSKSLPVSRHGCSARGACLPWGAWAHFPRSATRRRYDCHHALLGGLHFSRVPRSVRAPRGRGVPKARGWPKRPDSAGRLVTRSPSPGLSSRIPVALPSARVPPVKHAPRSHPGGVCALANAHPGLLPSALAHRRLSL